MMDHLGPMLKSYLKRINQLSNNIFYFKKNCFLNYKLNG